MILLMALIMFILFTFKPPKVVGFLFARPELSYPPKGTWKVAVWGITMLTIYVILLNYLYIKKLKGLKLIIANILILIGFFLILEGALRIYIDKDPPQFRPHPSLLWVRYDGVNSMGLEYEEFPAKKEPGEFRFILVGDSTAAADRGVRFSDHVESKLRNAYPNRKIRVINAACGGYSIFQVRELTRLKLYKLDPDCLIVSLNNDSHTEFDKDKNRVPGPFLMPIMRLLYKSNLYLLLKKLKFNREFVRFINEESVRFRNDPNTTKAVRRVSPENIKKFYGEVIDAMKQRGAKVIIIAMPTNYEGNDFPEDKVYKRQLRVIAAEKGAMFLDIYGEWKKQNYNHLHARNDKVHINHEGHKLLAERLFKFIIDNKIVDFADTHDR